MSLTKPPIPLPITRAFTTGLEDFIDPRDPLYSLLSQESTAIAAFNLKFPLPIPPIPPIHPVPPVPFSEKMKEWVLNDDAAPSSGYRFWAASGDLYGACHVGSINAGSPPRVTGFSDAVEVLTGIEQFNLLSTMTELAPTAFEPRVLRVPWGRFEAFWLKSTDPKVLDRFVAFSGFPPKSLNPTKSHSWKHFRAAILPLVLQTYRLALAEYTAVREARARELRIQAEGAQALQEQVRLEDAAASQARRALADYASVALEVSEPEQEEAPGEAPVDRPKRRGPTKR